MLYETPDAHVLGTLWNYLSIFLNQSITEQSISWTAHPPLKSWKPWIEWSSKGLSLSHQTDSMWKNCPIIKWFMNDKKTLSNYEIYRSVKETLKLYQVLFLKHNGKITLVITVYVLLSLTHIQTNNWKSCKQLSK